MSQKQVSQTNQQGKGNTPLVVGILQRAAVKEIAEQQLPQQNQESRFQHDFTQIPVGGQRRNNTGLPDNLKAGIENLSGMAMDDVKVHYNSSKPAQVQALAYTQGTDIHVAPGQQQYLPHEAWHVVQQKQGRVKPTLQMKGGVAVNDNQELEKEADLMGNRAESVQFSKMADERSVVQEITHSQVIQKLTGQEIATAGAVGLVATAGAILAGASLPVTAAVGLGGALLGGYLGPSLFGSNAAQQNGENDTAARFAKIILQVEDRNNLFKIWHAQDLPEDFRNEQIKKNFDQKGLTKNKLKEQEKLFNKAEETEKLKIVQDLEQRLKKAKDDTHQAVKAYRNSNKPVTGGQKPSEETTKPRKVTSSTKDKLPPASSVSKNPYDGMPSIKLSNNTLFYIDGSKPSKGTVSYGRGASSTGNKPLAIVPGYYQGKKVELHVHLDPTQKSKMLYKHTGANIQTSDAYLYGWGANEVSNQTDLHEILERGFKSWYQPGQYSKK